MLRNAERVRRLGSHTAFAQIVYICVLCRVTIVAVWQANVACGFSEQSCARSVAAEGVLMQWQRTKAVQICGLKIADYLSSAPASFTMKVSL